jgi:predicted kinase
VLIFFCGKMGAGKSTLAQAIAQERGALLLSEDEWLAQLYPQQVASLQDYKAFSSKIKPLVRQIAQSALKGGLDVVLDFPGNTVDQRAWLRQVGDDVGAEHMLYYIDIADEICLARIAQRGNPGTDTPQMFDAVGRYFTAPTVQERLNIIPVHP